VSTKLNNELKDANKLKAEMKRTVARMYSVLNASTWTDEEGRMERSLFSLFENTVRQSLQAFSSLDRTDRTFKSQCIGNANNVEDAVEGILKLLTANNENGDDLILAIKGDEPVSTS
jgi:hypothetical protein